MNDTSPIMEERFRNLLMARSGEERLKMGCSMHATATALVRAAIRENTPNASPEQTRRELFLRFYRQDFDPLTQQRILEHIVKTTTGISSKR